jgi:ABC-2 type transport system permease protein
MTLWLLQFRYELIKLFARKRTYIGFAAFVVLEVVLLGLLRLPKVQDAFRRLIETNGFAFDEYFSGLTLAFFVVVWTVFLLGGLYLALVAGDVVAKEVEDGAMRMILCRPVTRARLLAIKWLACILYTFALTFFIAASALLFGLIERGLGGLFVFAPGEQIFALFDPVEGFVRLVFATLLLSLSLCALSSFAFFLSCWPIKPAAATIVTLTYFFLDSILRQIPYFESLKPWFVSERINAWLLAFASPIPWHALAEDYAILTAFSVTLLLAAIAIFEARDFKA